MCRWKILDSDGEEMEIDVGGLNKETEKDRGTWSEGCRGKKTKEEIGLTIQESEVLETKGEARCRINQA